jgi:peptidoglycan/xylan/chitin deacetylase (PgdA/CDA1 family)
MKLVSPLLKHFVYPGLSKAGYLSRAETRAPTVLTYHGVLPAGYKIVDPDLDGNLVTSDSFRQQLRFVKDRYNVISPEEFFRWLKAEHELPPRCLLLTCDDGLRNSLVEMVPVLQEFGLKCLFFVTGASLRDAPTMLWYEELYLMFLAANDNFTLELSEIGVQVSAGKPDKRSLWSELVRKFSQYNFNRRRVILDRIEMQLGLSEQWDRKYHEDPELSSRFLVLDRSELHDLSEAGMCIGAHTLSHPVLSQSSSDIAWHEISESKRHLEQALGREMWAMAYPFGDSSSVTSRELQMSERAGFKCAFLNVAGEFTTQTPKFSLPRVHITGEMNLAQFAAHVSGFHRTLQGLFRASLSTSAGASA